MRFLLAIAFLCFAFGSALANEPDTTATEAKMTSIVIPEINLQNVKLIDALSAFWQLAADSDKETDPSKKRGVNFFLKVGPGEAREQPVTLSMKNATVGEIAEAIAKQCNLTVKPEPHAIAFVPNNP